MGRPQEWTLMSSECGVETWHRYEVTSDGRTLLHVKQEWNPAWQEAMLERAAAERSANAGKRWGDGQVVGRVPLPLYFSSGLAEAARQQDEAWRKRFWNDPDNSRLRTFEGKL
jgi:hypothetical protein